ncbi:aminotransferase class I/II-fold pyridoxal phosphate-dependent enzyme [Chloroflexota bacterium]
MAKIKPLFFAGLELTIAKMKAEGRDVIRLDVGSPDLPPAEFIIDALIESAKLTESHGYQSHKGPPRLREAWAEMYERIYQVDLNPENEVLPLLGSKEGIFHLMQAYVQHGDVVLLPDPGYITYDRGTIFAGGDTVKLPLTADSNYLLVFETLSPEILQRAKVLWLNYPNNPTTAVASRAFFEEAVAFAHRNNLLLCHDAAYTQVTFDVENAPSILEIRGAKEIAVEFNSLSKSHNMAGWRSGSLVGNPEVVRELYRLKTNVDSGHFLPVIEASIEALTGDQSWIRARNEVYRRRRDVVLSFLHEMGLAADRPCATIYVWSPIPDGWNCADFVRTALEETGVSMTPGTVFGLNGEGFVRISLTVSNDRLRTAMERLKGWIQK